MTVYVLNRIDKDPYYSDKTTLIGIFSSTEKREKYMYDNPLNCGYSYGSYWDWEDIEIDALEKTEI
jgi:hypothetical protein